MNRLTCPCCGYQTVVETYDICRICFWEYDEVMHERHDEAGGANGVSLREAQRNYARCGAVHETAVKYTRKPTPEDKRDPNWKPLD